MVCDPVMFTIGIPFICKLGHGGPVVNRAIKSFKANAKEEAGRSWSGTFIKVEGTSNEERALAPNWVIPTNSASTDDFFSSVMAEQRSMLMMIALSFLPLKLLMRLSNA